MHSSRFKNKKWSNIFKYILKLHVLWRPWLVITHDRIFFMINRENNFLVKSVESRGNFQIGEKMRSVNRITACVNCWSLKNLTFFWHLWSCLDWTQETFSAIYFCRNHSYYFCKTFFIWELCSIKHYLVFFIMFCNNTLHNINC